MQKITTICICAVVAALISGCAGTGEIMHPTKLAAPAKSVSPNQKESPAKPGVQETKAINVTPLSKYTDEWNQNASSNLSFADTYTRLLVFSKLPGDGDQASEKPAPPLAYEERQWWERAFVGRDFSVSLSAKVSVGSFEATVPLATIGHQSNSDGEQWSRAIHHSKANFPLFLVKTDGSGSIPVIKLAVSGTKSYSSRGAAAAVQAVLGVAQASGQPLGVITRLSEQSTKDKARAVDTALSKLFSSGITEEHWTDRDLRFWSIDDTGRPRGVTVDFSIPGEKDWNAPLNVGRWTLTFDFPRLSIFSDWRICDTVKLPRCAATPEEAAGKILGEIDQGEVLNYVLWNGDNNLGTVKAFVAQQDWYVSAQIALAAGATAVPAAESLCRRIANEITGLGLSSFDARVVVWAVTTGMPLPAKAPDFAKLKGCGKIIPIHEARAPASSNHPAIKFR
jgi:hypothetical protein